VLDERRMVEYKTLYSEIDSLAASQFLNSSGESLQLFGSQFAWNSTQDAEENLADST